MAESKLVKLNFENNSYSVYSINLCIWYAKPWLHSDIRSCCCQSLRINAFTSRYDSTSRTWPHLFYTEGVFA